MDSNTAIWQVLIISFFPSIFLRAVSAIVYRNRDRLDFKNTAFFLKIFNNGTYGIWTLIHLIKYSSVSINCKENFTVSMTAFEMTIIFGCFPATHVLFAILVVLVICPLITYSHYNHYRERTRHQRMVKQLVSHFV